MSTKSTVETKHFRCRHVFTAGRRIPARETESIPYGAVATTINWRLL